MTESSEAGGSQLDRRSLMKKMAVGGAIAWTTPVLLSVPASAQGSCLPTVVDWANFVSGINDLDTTPLTGLPIGSITYLDVAFDASGMGTGTADPLYAASANPLGSETASFIELNLDADAANQFCTLTFAFNDGDVVPAPLAVQTLAFTLLDIDLGSGAWQDEVTLTATLAGSPVTLGVADYSFDTNFVQHSDVLDIFNVKVGDRFTGILEADNNSADANVIITYPSPIDTLVITYRALPEATDPQVQQIGITSLDICAF